MEIKAGGQWRLPLFICFSAVGNISIFHKHYLCNSTLCNPTDYGPPGSSVHEILQVRILEWVAICVSRGSSQPRGGTWVFHIAGKFFTT